MSLAPLWQLCTFPPNSRPPLSWLLHQLKCLPGDLTSGGSLVYNGARQKNLTLRPKECRESPAVPLRKKKAGRVLNGLSLEPCKKTVHHQRSSDQENNPRLVHTQGKKKKKNLNKKHKRFLFQPSSQIAANVFDLWH
ncbi:hypothetical protein F7725_007112 [Dissostichus mawsoni]|uniref:Uncharacterized protein n=1 Tax=Dissostichus mawsoni TaxID=36200 RepID=A0A7J5XVV0_DISMA|nr:hypothetical protein F7725_007112 [Dissostichus mawsoni]